MTVMQQKTEITSARIAAWWEPALSAPPPGDPAEGSVALQQLSLCQIHIVLDDKRRELLNPFVFSFLFPLLGRENLKLAAQFKKIHLFFCAQALLSADPVASCWRAIRHLAFFQLPRIAFPPPRDFPNVTFFPYLHFFPPPALNCRRGLKRTTVILLLAETPPQHESLRKAVNDVFISVRFCSRCPK